MALADRQEGDSTQLTRVNSYNKKVIEHITEKRQENYQAIQGLLSDDKLEDTLAKHLLVDSAGQHKDNCNKKRKLA